MIKLSLYFSLISATFAFTEHAMNRKTIRHGITPASRTVHWSTKANLADNGINYDAADEKSQIRHDADTIFSIIDKDGNGSISRRELTNHLTSAGYTYAVVNSIFSKLDLNKDGKISRKEFRNGFVLFSSLRSAKGLGNYHAEFEEEIFENADSFFQDVDIDGNGAIDMDELKMSLKLKFSSKAVQNIFNMLDVNNDGTISKEELRDAFVRYSALRLSIGKDTDFN